MIGIRSPAGGCQHIPRWVLLRAMELATARTPPELIHTLGSRRNARRRIRFPGPQGDTVCPPNSQS